MLRFILRRVGTSLITMLVLSMLVFALSNVLPIDPVIKILGHESTPEAQAALREQMGLNRPIGERYANWLVRFVQGDWGDSYRLGVPIFPLVRQRLGNSLVIALMALLIIVPLSLTLGIIAGLNEARWPDRVISIGSLLTISIPDYLIGLVFIIVFSWWLKWLPADSTIRNAELDLSRHLPKLILPSITAAFVLVGYIARITRTSMIEVMDSPYIRTAILKGLPYRTVIIRHALRNALIAPVAIITNQIAWLVGGLILIEWLFNFPGLGSLFANASLNNDLPMIAASSMTAVVLVVFSQLVADVLFMVLNPRIRFN